MLADCRRVWAQPVLLFSKLNKICFGYFEPDFFFQIMRINDSWGELTDSSAKKTLGTTVRCSKTRETAYRSMPVFPQPGIVIVSSN